MTDTPAPPITIRESGVQRVGRALVSALVPALAAAGCDNGSARPSSSPAGDGQGPVAAWEVVATGLEVPWDLGFAPDGRTFVTERPGRIRVLQDGQLMPEPWAVLDVEAVSEAGLTALAIAPDFDETGHVFVVGTFRTEEGLRNRVMRLTDRDGRGTDPRVIVDGLPADRIHAGSALDFGPDGFLWVSSGDAGEPDRVPDPSSLHGKILRYRADGTPAPDNPLPGPVWASGVRNPQGLDWNEAGQGFATEHGPSGLPWEAGRTGHDELNRLEPGAGYGWPEVAGEGGGPSTTDPLAVWDPAIAPSGLAVYTGDQLPDWQGDVFLGALRGRHLRRVAVEGSGAGARVTEQEVLFQDELGRIRAVVTAPDGSLWFTTSNRDGRGNPAEDDDRILRLVPGGG